MSQTTDASNPTTTETIDPKQPRTKKSTSPKRKSNHGDLNTYSKALLNKQKASEVAKKQLSNTQARRLDANTKKPPSKARKQQRKKRATDTRSVSQTKPLKTKPTKKIAANGVVHIKARSLPKNNTTIKTIRKLRNQKTSIQSIEPLWRAIKYVTKEYLGRDDVKFQKSFRKTLAEILEHQAEETYKEAYLLAQLGGNVQLKERHVNATLLRKNKGSVMYWDQADFEKHDTYLRPTSFPRSRLCADYKKNGLSTNQ